MTVLSRPALRYYGGKWRLADWVIAYLPEHVCYVEPFGGAASVLLQKPPSELEVYNDLDSNVVNFFRVLREREKELLRLIRLTPFAREEHLRAKERCDDDLEQARRFYVRAIQGISGASDITGWRFQKNGRRGKSVVRDWNESEHLRAVAERMRSVQIEHDDALKVIQRFDGPDTLFYCDPPYPGATRHKRWWEKGYAHEMEDDDHRALARVLHDIEGMAVVSSYPSALYAELYAGWQVATTQARINSMHAGAALKTEGLRRSRLATSGRVRAARGVVLKGASNGNHRQNC